MAKRLSTAFGRYLDREFAASRKDRPVEAAAWEAFTAAVHKDRPLDEVLLKQLEDVLRAQRR